MLGHWLRHRRRQKARELGRLPPGLWERLRERHDWLARLAGDESDRLRDLAVMFLAEKRFWGAHGFEVGPEIQATIAIQACLPILNLGLDWYLGWRNIIVYPGVFRPRHEIESEDGLVHVVHEPTAGESWLGGPVILAWSESRLTDDTASVVIHEFAHKLDMLNGSANGMPPLHRDMDRRAWTRDFVDAYDHFCAMAERGEALPWDEYACQDPAEFFAVSSEIFFLEPRKLHCAYPHVYAQLSRFFRQYPVTLKRPTD